MRPLQRRELSMQTASSQSNSDGKHFESPVINQISQSQFNSLNLSIQSTKIFRRFNRSKSITLIPETLNIPIETTLGPNVNRVTFNFAIRRDCGEEGVKGRLTHGACLSEEAQMQHVRLGHDHLCNKIISCQIQPLLSARAELFMDRRSIPPRDNDYINQQEIL